MDTPAPRSSDLDPAQLIYLTDRTTVETDWECGMKRWWYKEEAGTGIVPLLTPAALLEGGEVHEAFAAVASLPDLRDLGDILPQPPSAQVDLETWARLVGWMTALAQWVEPRWREEGTTLAVEREYVLDRDPLWFACTPDRVNQRPDGSLVYREFKSTNAKDTTKWAAYWPTAIQLHVGILALMEAEGASRVTAQVTGMTKGYEMKGLLRHPYTYAYVGPNGQWQREYKYGWDLVGTWEYPGGPRAWALHLGEATAQEVFPQSHVVYLNRRLVDQMLAQRLEREREVAHVRAMCQRDPNMRARYFEQRFTKCRPSFGFQCSYLSACHNASVAANPLLSGEYTRRVPHHDLERVKFADSEVTE